MIGIPYRQAARIVALAVVQRDAERDRADVEAFLADHVQRFEDVEFIEHGTRSVQILCMVLKMSSCMVRIFRLFALPMRVMASTKSGNGTVMPSMSVIMIMVK